MRLNAFLLALLAAAPALTAAPLRGEDAWERAARTGELRWGMDLTGGAPYTFPAEDDPARVDGFEVDIMQAVAQRLGLRLKMSQTPWDQLVPVLLRGDFDVALNGLEVTPEREEVVGFTRPYYLFAEQLTVRRGDGRFGSLDDLRGRRAGTLSASLAQNILEGHGGITVVAYPSPVEAYRDLEVGRLDAVLLDVPIAAWYAGKNPKLENLPHAFGEGLYAGAVRKDSPKMLAKLNEALAALGESGELERIYRKWDIWTPDQLKVLPAPAAPARGAGGGVLRRYLPLLLKGAAVTVAISLASMALAALAGLAICLGRLYGRRPLQAACTAYVEVVRGTPLLIQLYLLYYGLPNLGIQLNAFVAAVLGMGLNYAAYEAEIYRAGLLAVPKGQWEAARSLGLSGRQSFWHVVFPQAVRTILPPSTNDFIALFKDTSLVSVITVTELTRVYSHAATASYRFMELGLATAALYFAMSYPLSLWSRRLEKERHAALH